MKKILSIILAVVMIASLLPATFMTAAAADGDNTDIVFDFTAGVTADTLTALVGDTSWHGAADRDDYTQKFNWNNGILATMLPEGISINATLGLGNSMYGYNTGNGPIALRVFNHKSNWLDASYNTRLAFDIAISVEQAGWYRPSITFTTSNGGTTAYYAYMVSDGVATYLGDVSLATNNVKLNPVLLGEGTHTLVLGCYLPGGNSITPTSYIESFTLHAEKAAPAIDAASITAPATLAVGETGTVDASAIVLSDGSAYAIAAYAMNPTSGASILGASTVDYIKVTSSEPYVATVAKTTATTSTITPKHEGTTTLTITPVVGGVEMTSLATTKTLTVTDPTNIIFDFYAWIQIHGQGATADKSIARFDTLKASNSPAGIAVNPVSAANKEIYWETSPGSESLRFGNVVSDWTSGLSSNNKFVFDITVPAEKAGVYTMAMPFSGTAGMSNIFTIYHVHNGVATYIGDINPSEYTTLPFEMKAGTNTIAICATEGINVAYISSMKFMKYTGTLPTMTAVEATIPESVIIDETIADLSATIAMSDGSVYRFPKKSINTETFMPADADTYIKVEASPAGVVEVVSTIGNSAVNFSIKGLKAGTTDLTFTPVIAGVPQTELKTTKTIKVKTWDITYDLLASAAAATAAGKEKIKFTEDSTCDDFMPEGISTNWEIGTNSDKASNGAFRWDNGRGLRFTGICSDWLTETTNHYNRATLNIEISADEAGWYRPNIDVDDIANAYSEAYKFYVYMISGDKVTYLGEHSKAVNGTDMNPVYLGKGTHTLVMAFQATPREYYAVWLHKITLKKLDTAPTVATFSANIPTSIAYGGAADITVASATMSDGGSLAFATYGANTAGDNTGFDTTGTSDYIKVESSNPSVATVTRVDAGTWTITPVKDGETIITVTPYFNGVAQAPVHSKKVLVTYPNESLSGTQSILVDAIVGNSGEYNTEGLIVSEDITVGNVEYPAVGSTVTLTAKSTNALTFLYWYNGNTKKILSDKETYSFKVGTKGAIYAKYADVEGELTEYANSAAQLVADTYDAVFSKEHTVGDYYTIKAEEADGTDVKAVTETNANAVYWTKDGKIVSYETTYSYYPWTGTEEVVAETTGEKSDVPAVVLFENGDARMLELVNFDRVEILEKGILFGREGKPNVNSFDTKAVSTTDKKQFMATSDLAYARAYVIYKDSTGYRVAYSD